MERRRQRVRSPRAKCSFVQRGWWPQAARATAGEGRYDQILKCSERSTQQIRYRPTGPQAPWDRIRANADNRKASRTSLFERLGSQRRLRESLRGEDATVLLINTYRTSVSGVLRRKDSGFAVCGENPASVSRFVAGIRHSSRMLRSLCKNERQLMSQEALLSSAAAACATRAQQPERSTRTGARDACITMPLAKMGSSDKTNARFRCLKATSAGFPLPPGTPGKETQFSHCVNRGIGPCGSSCMSR